MVMGFRVAVIGTGDPSEQSADGYAMAYRHADAYVRLTDCELVACADIVMDNAVAFAEEYGIGPEEVYEDAKRMLAEAKPDIVNVCVPPAAHAELVCACADADSVEAIHCEKPIAATWQECQEMLERCERHDTQLTINHQRRFAKPYRLAKDLLDEGRIGDVRRIEVGGQNLYDYGSHLFDLCGFLTDQTPVEWVLAQIEYREENVQFGMHNETQGLARWRYENGIDGLASTGEDGLVDCQIRVIGSRGTVEVGRIDGPPLRVRTDGSGWERVETGPDGIYKTHPKTVSVVADALLERFPVGPDRTFAEPSYIDRAVEDVVESLREDRRLETAARNACQAMELIFACWESARRRDRVTLPLDIENNPLEAMVRSGVLPTEEVTSQ